ncbi:endonuclease [uncultured Tenacibaculum sp.]|uniref:endonuclease n=1 Tax=uncultured Tenacibaculum sp. TaxID=174713 RepID=UPI00262C3D4E|nr:endonuclease [uncultured Tenacibaculum sp.]
MKRTYLLGLLTLFFMGCGGNDSDVAPPKTEDKVVAVNDTYDATENKSFVLSSFLSNDTYTQGKVKLTFEASSNKGGTVVKEGDNLKYTPAANFVGTDTFSYTICSTITTSTCATATITINVVDAGTPVAVNDSYETNENETLTISNYLDNDTIVDDATVASLDSAGSSGTVTLNSDKTITYVPKTDFTGTDTFTYKICDNDNPNTCATATITVTIKSTGGNTGSFNIPSDLTSYYNSVDFTQTGTSLREALATITINSHTDFLSYTPGVWNALKASDLDPTDNSKVLLIYGYSDTDGNYVTDRSRGVNDNGGTQGTDWNREHVYPRSLGIPNLGSSGPGSDAHHLRPSDVKMNSNRGSKKFATGSGNAGDASGGWYPGDEWKGDVARMMMYMYIRYGNQCLPKNVALGSANSADSNMIDLLLEWNADDPISDFEKNRNNEIAKVQGNRNPFIDNPYLASVIWGGTDAENTWK